MPWWPSARPAARQQSFGVRAQSDVYASFGRVQREEAVPPLNTGVKRGVDDESEAQCGRV